VASGEELHDLWVSVDAALKVLDNFIDKNVSTKSKPQSTISSIALKFLPMIEAFFLVYAADILAPGKQISDSATYTTSGAATTTLTDDRERESNVVSTASPDIVSIPSPSIPGAIYRTTSAYNLINVPLHNDGLSETGNTVTTSALRPLLSFRSSTTPCGRPHRLLTFVQQHQNILNTLLQLRPTLLDESFSCLIRITQLRNFLSFDNKRAYFFSQLKKLSSRWSRSRRTIGLQVRRDRIFEDSFHQLRMRTADELRGRLAISFHGEEGVDAGGLTREWFLVLSREIFNPNYALFTVAADGATFQPNPLSYINQNHLEYFKFVGRLIGKAVVDGHLMDAHFTR
jgi:hypothetical protein